MSDTIYPWGDSRRFNSYSNYFRKLFGERVQKVTINGDFTCPNRDGAVGVGGCTFCLNQAFTPSYCIDQNRGIEWQIREGMEFHRRRYRNASRFLAYFQSFSNTYAPLDQLKEVYSQALAIPEVAGLVIGTRPDCIDGQKLDYFSELSKKHYIAIEYGVESCHDTTLRAVNRGHDFATAINAIEATARRGINVGAHFILGLPGESDSMLIEQCSTINKLPITTIKFHQLQIFKGTEMERDYSLNPSKYRFWELSEYVDLFIEILERLRPDIVVERFVSEAPPRYHTGPNWGRVRNEHLLVMLESRLASRNTYQGRLFK